MKLEISPLDGRYRGSLSRLGQYFSEFGLTAARLRVELDYLLAMDATGLFDPLNDNERSRIDSLMQEFSEPDFKRIKTLESETRHDVKACERYLRERLRLRDPNRVHFALTSEDVNNLAYNLLLRAFVDEQLVPALSALLAQLCDLAERYADQPMPTRTHGQMASPSTAGKELAVFASRLARPLAQIKSLRLRAKLGGATGTLATWCVAFPDHDWLAFARAFVEGFGFDYNPCTTQIEDHDTWAELFGMVRRAANIVIDLDRDMWMYLALGLFRAPAVAGEVGSSTMPHKVNPIRFENSEGNLELAVGMLSTLTDKLGRSRMQRDLSDSTVTRNIGVTLAHVMLGVAETRAGLERVEVNRQRCEAELRQSPELLAEPIQTVLRVAGIGQDPYELLRQHTRGQQVTREGLMALIEQLAIADEVKQRLRDLQVRDYVGLAPEICRRTIARVRSELLSDAAEQESPV